MGLLKELGKMSAGVVESMIGPFIGRFDLAQAVGYKENAGAPTSVTPDFIGQLLFDTTGADFYRAYAVTSGAWVLAGFDTLSATELSALDGALSTNAVASKVALLDSASQLNLSASTLAVEAPAGITGGVGTVYKTSVEKVGGIFRTSILIDLTGLSSSTTDLDVIGQGAAAAAHIGQITAARNGTILTGKVTCLEVPVGGVTDIDVYLATVGTGKFDDAISGLAGFAAMLTSGGAWTLALSKAFAEPAALANAFLYLTCGAGGTAAPYTAGKFLIELEGY